jgi:Bacterial membrane protein YfhO
VHAELEVPNAARPGGAPRGPSAEAGSRRLRPGVAALWSVALLAIVSLSVADGLLANVVPYERDTTVFYFPLMEWAAQRLRQGELPLWTPQVFGGYPIFADGEIGLAYPPVLLALLALPPDRAFVILRLVHLSIAAFGTFALARTWGLPYASAVLAGVVFALGNFLQAQIHHENIVRTASWLPVMLALVERALRSGEWRPQLRWTLLGAVALGLAGLSLHSQMLAIDLLILGSYATMRVAVGPLGSIGNARGWPARLGLVASVCAPVVVIGLGLAALQLVPLIELAGFSARGTGIPYTESAAYSLTPYGLVQAIFPYVFRGPENMQWGLWTHWESYLYVGLAPLVLAIIALICVRRREVVGWGLLGGLGLLLALGQYSPINLHYVLWLLPGLSGLRAPGRFTVIVILAGGMLAAYGLAWLQGGLGPEASDTRRLRRTLFTLTAALACLGSGVFGLHYALLTWPSQALDVIERFYLSLPRDTYALNGNDVISGLLWSTDFSNPRVASALLVLALVMAALWFWQVATSPAVRAWRGWPVLLVGLAAADLLIFAWSIHPREPLSKIAAKPPAIQAIEQLPPRDGAPNRILSSQVLTQIAPDRLASFGVQEASGYSSLQFVWHRDYLGRVQYVDDGMLDLWNVRFILDPARYGALFNYKGVSFLPSQALLHAPAGSGLAEQRFALSPDSSIVELRLVTAMLGAVELPQGTPVALVELRSSANEVIGTAELVAGRDAMEWSSDLPSVQPFLQHQRVEVAAVTVENGAPRGERHLSFADFIFDPPLAAASMTVRATSPTGEFALFGGTLIGADGSEQQLFGRTKVKYQQVYVDNDIRVVEDTAALPRAFLVPRARVAPSLGTALNEMIHRPFAPDQEVILAADGTGNAPVLETDRGGYGTARVTAYAADAVRIHTSANDDAWLVLSDTYYPGWVATIDGQPASVLRGDVLFRVVPLPAGEHDVEFRFEPASVKLGLLISLGSLLVAAGALFVAGRSPRRGRTTSL